MTVALMGFLPKRRLRKPESEENDEDTGDAVGEVDEYRLQ